MEKIKTNFDKAKSSLIFKLLLCFIFALIIGIVNSNSALAASNGKAYLSDMTAKSSKVSAGHLLKLDRNDSDKLITLKVGGKEKVFVKGIAAWATSEVIYDLNGYDYDYFESYIGVDISEQSDYFNTGVKFRVYTSDDCDKWNEVYASKTVFYGWSEAEHIHIELNNAKYLKLVADNNSPNWWAEWYDEAIFADAKLIKEGYVEQNTSQSVDFIDTVENYDSKLKSFLENGKTNTDEFELTLLQREFVKNFNYDILIDFVNCEERYKETVKWLMTDIRNMRLYIYGGEPDGNYISSMQVLSDLYHTYKSDLEISELTKSGLISYGELYRKMMITLSLTHSAQVALWMDTTSPENQSSAVTRYKLFKDLHKDGKFIVSKNEDGTPKQDHTPWFETLEVEEMRYVLNNIIDDESIIWLNEYTQRRIDSNPNQEEKYLQPHPYMKYIDPNYANPEFHKAENYAKWDEKYEKVFSKYGVTYRDGVYKLWMNIEGGSVCGGISKIGSNIRGVHGTPSSVISQPGHAALIYWRQDKDGNGYWTIDNDVSGWSQSGKTEKLSVRMPLGWGSDEYVEGWAASYIVLAQEALNNYKDYVDSMKYIYLANSYEGNPSKQLELYEKAIEIQSINIDAWYGIIKLYEADTSKTEEEYFELAERVGDALKCYPLPMYNLTNVIAKHLTSTKYSFKFTILQAYVLREGSEWKNPENASKDGKKDYSNYVYQPSITNTVAKFLLGQMDSELATFSFDGENSGEIVLSSRFDNSGLRWDYTLDGKNTPEDQWTKVDFTAEQEHKLKLSDEEISKISADNDIYVHIVGLNYSDENLYKIDILPQEISSNIYANDLENRFMGVDAALTEWRYAKNSEISTVSTISETADNSEWTLFETETPTLKGDVSVEIRQRATGTKLASKIAKYDFTSTGEDSVTRRYVPVSHLSIEKVSTEAVAQGRYAKNAIDGNYNTNFHSDWNGRDTERYMIIKIDRPLFVSGIEYVPGGGGNGRLLEVTIEVSSTGEDGSWKTIYHNDSLTYVDTNKANDPDFGLKNIKKFDTELTEDELEEIGKVQYVRITANKATNGNWFTARMFNIFENVKLNPQPTAGIEFNTTEPTTGDVVAKVTNFSTDSVEMINFEDITEQEIISEDIDVESLKNNSTFVTLSEDKKTATFTDNDKYTFIFKNTDTGHVGFAIADVNWIDRKAPEAHIEYSTEDVTTGEVVARLVADEEIHVVNNAHTDYNDYGKLYTFTHNGDFTFEYEDLAGNPGEPIKAEVTWIRTAAASPDGYLPGDPSLEEPGIGDEEEQGGDNTNPGEQQEQGGSTTTPEEQQGQSGSTTKPEEQQGQSGSTTTPEEQQGQSGSTTNPEEQQGQSGSTTKPEEQQSPSGNSSNSNGQQSSSGSSSNKGNSAGSGTANQENGKEGNTVGNTVKNITENTTGNKTGNTLKPTNEIKQANVTNNEKTGNTLSNKDLPKTGRSAKPFIVAGISMAVTASLIFYVKYINVGKKKNRK